MYVRNRRSHRLTPRVEIWHGGPHQSQKGQRVCLSLPPPTPGRGRSMSASGGPCSPDGAFLRKLYKTKVEEHPQFSIGGSGPIRSQTSPRCLAGGPSARGASAGMVSWLSVLKLGREMGTHPGRSIPMFGLCTLNPRFRGP